MKIDVPSPEFCPDNCPYAEIEVERLYSENNLYTHTYKCNNVNRCEMLLKQIKKQINEE